MEKFTRSQRCLLSVHVLKMIMDLFISTFLTSFILSQTPESILGKGLFNIGLFYFSWYLIYTIFEFVCSYFVDRGNRDLFLRIAIIINTCLILALVFWGEQISHWIIPAGAVCGLVDAFYYSSYLIMRTGLAKNQTIKKYNFLTTLFTNLVKVIIPIILGYVIEASTLSTIAIYIVIISIIQFIISLFIKSDKNERSNFEFKKFLNYLKTNKDDFNKLKYTYFSDIPSGFKATYTILIVVITVYVFKKDSILGVYTSIFSLITALLIIIYKILDKNPKINKLFVYLIVGFMPLVCSILVAIKPDEVVLLVLLNFSLTVACYFSDFMGNTERDTIIKIVHQTEFISEHQVFNELIQGVGKLISFGLFMIVGLTSNFTLFLVMMIFLVIFNPFKYIILYKQRQIRKKFETAENN